MTDAEAETPILWPLHVKSWLIGKDPDAGKDWGQEEKGTTEDEMAGWHHRLDEHEVWVNSGSWWWTGRPGVLRFMGSQRVRHNWATELNWTEVQEDTRIWTHKNLYLKTSDYLKACFSVLFCFSFPEHRLSYFPSLSWTPFKGVLKVSILQWSWFNLCRGIWQGPTFSQQGLFIAIYLTMFWGHFMVIVSLRARKAHS